MYKPSFFFNLCIMENFKHIQKWKASHNEPSVDLGFSVFVSQAASTDYLQLSGLNNRNLLPEQFWRLGSLRSGASKADFDLRLATGSPSPCALLGSSLWVHRDRERASSLVSLLLRTLIPSAQGPTLNYFPIGPISKHRHIGG